MSAELTRGDAFAMVYPGYQGPIRRAWDAGEITKEQRLRAGEIMTAALAEIGFDLGEVICLPGDDYRSFRLDIPIAAIEKASNLALVSVGARPLDDTAGEDA